MGKIVTALASSHAFTLVEPDKWDEFREKIESITPSCMVKSPR